MSLHWKLNGCSRRDWNSGIEHFLIVSATRRVIEQFKRENVYYQGNVRKWHQLIVVLLYKHQNLCMCRILKVMLAAVTRHQAATHRQRNDG